MKNKSIVSNLLQQNCFVRDFCSNSSLQEYDPDSVDKFLSLDEKVDADGLHVELNSYDYPITPQYVKSFAASADYHNDPVSAINNSVSRVNLGDISHIQDISSLDTLKARALYEQLRARFVGSNSGSTSSVDGSAEKVNVSDDLGGDK